MMEKVAAQLFSVRDLMKTPPEMAKTLARIQQAGYRAVQVSGIGPIDPTELRKICDGLGLTICASHTGYNDLMNDLPAVIAKHKIWGCSQIAVPVTPVIIQNEQGYVEFASQMTKVGKELCNAGITFTYHNHSFEFQKFGDKLGLELIYEKSDPKYLQAEIDTYWIQHGGGNPVAWCRRMKGRLPLLHLKDYGIVNNQPTFMEIGEGNLNWQEIFAAAKEAGTLWYIVEQDVCPGDPVDSLAKSYRNLKKMFSE
jgi:sugar phosphate isomerase/epimerase